MRVFYRVLQGDFQASGEPEFCCPRMEEEFGHLVLFGTAGRRRFRAPVVNLVTTHITADHDSLTGVVPIHHCPWCGRSVGLVDVSQRKAIGNK